MKSKSFLGSNKYNLEEIEEKERRENNAKYLLGKIKKSKVSWYRREMLRNLYFYLDFAFVRDELLAIYRSCDDKALKRDIKSLHDGSLDVSDLIAMAEENQKLFNEGKEEIAPAANQSTIVASDLLKFYKHDFRHNN